MSDRTDLAAAAGSSSIVIDDCWNRIGVRGDRSCPELEQHVHCRNCPVQRAVAVELLAQHVPADYSAQWTEHVSRPAKQTDRDTASAVIFRIGTEWLALPAAAIQEISNLRPIHRVPHRTSGVVLGVVNVRGELLTCVSLARVFGLEGETAWAHSGGSASSGSSALSAGPAPSGGPGPSALLGRKRLLVIRRKDLRAACPVDYVEGVHRYAPAALSAVPATVAKAGTRYSRALLAWRDQAVGVLDEELLFPALKRGMA
jgi:chemotaxis-related protein WspD